MKRLSFFSAAVILIAATIGTEALMPLPAKRPNNVYELVVFPEYFIIKDGDRVVDTLPFGNKGQLDTVILKDNQ